MIKAGLRNITNGYQFSQIFNSHVLHRLRVQIGSDNFVSLILGYGNGYDIDLGTLGLKNFLLDITPDFPMPREPFRDKKFTRLVFDLTGLSKIKTASGAEEYDFFSFATGKLAGLKKIPLDSQSIDFIFSSLNLTMSLYVSPKIKLSEEVTFTYKLLRYVIMIHQISDIVRLLKPGGYFSIAYHSHVGDTPAHQNLKDYLVAGLNEARAVRALLNTKNRIVDPKIFIEQILINSGYFLNVCEPWIKSAEKKVLTKEMSGGTIEQSSLVRLKAFQRSAKTFELKDFEKLVQDTYQKLHRESY